MEKYLAEQGLDGVDVVGSSMGAPMVVEKGRRGHAGTAIALDPGGFWNDRQVRIFKASLTPSVALVRRIQTPASLPHSPGRRTDTARFLVR